MEPMQIIEDYTKVFSKPVNEALATGQSEIIKFYQNKTVFITGGSGFLGKQLIEKLIRCCNIKKAIILLRSKKEKTPQERLKDMLSDLVFDEARRLYPDFSERLVAVEGDVGELDLGLGAQDRETVADEVEIIFNMAATIRFDEKLKMAILINVRGTREALKLAKSCKRLLAFVHVSTAYTNAVASLAGQEVAEQFYPVPVHPAALVQMAEGMVETRLDEITPSLINDWPNTYAFTKSAAEELVRLEAQHLRVAVVRPAIVICSYREPFPGWIDRSCVFGPTGLVVGVGLGVIRTLYVDSSRKLSFVPVDVVNNATLAAAWSVTRRDAAPPVIYNVSTTRAGVTFKNVSDPMRQDFCRYVGGTPMAIWYCFLIETSNYALYCILDFLLHKLPAYLVDGVIALFKIKKPKELKSFSAVYEKVDKLSSIFSYYLTNDWNFDDKNLTALSNEMSEVDRTIFNFDTCDIDWNNYTLFWCLSARRFIVKDGMKNWSEETKKKQNYLKMAHWATVLIACLIFWEVISFIFALFVE